MGWTDPREEIDIYRKERKSKKKKKENLAGLGGPKLLGTPLNNDRISVMLLPLRILIELANAGKGGGGHQIFKILKCVCVCVGAGILFLVEKNKLSSYCLILKNKQALKWKGASK